MVVLEIRNLDSIQVKYFLALLLLQPPSIFCSVFVEIQTSNKIQRNLIFPLLFANMLEGFVQFQNSV